MSQFHEPLPSTGGKAQSFTFDSVRRTSHPQVVHNVALVLGGGGAAGNAWEIGVIAGLAEAGLDMTEAADLVVGTSAGATAAAQVRSGIPPAELLASVLSPPVRPVGQDRERPELCERRGALAFVWTERDTAGRPVRGPAQTTGMGRGPGEPGRGPAQARQPRRGDHTGRRFPSCNGHEPDGSGDAHPHRPCRFRPRQAGSDPREVPLTISRPADQSRDRLRIGGAQPERDRHTARQGREVVQHDPDHRRRESRTCQERGQALAA